MTDRGQMFTVESIAAAMLLLGTVVFVTQTAGVTALTASTASQQVSEGRYGDAVGVLDAATTAETVRPTLLHWDEANGSFHGTGDERYFVSGGPPTAFGTLLNETFTSRDVTFNVNVVYVETDGEQARVPLVRQGTPSDEAVVATRTVTLYDDDVLRDADGNRTSRTLGSLDPDSFYVPDRSAGPVYNVVRVEVVVWPV
jgi:hypothetical protein